MKTEQQQVPVPEPARGHDVFVSYSRADREVVVHLTQALSERGKRAWVDLEDIPPSAEWMGEIRAAIGSADGYLVVVSPDLARSSVCAEELEHAKASGKRIVPVLVRPTDPASVPQALSALNWIDATQGLSSQVLDRIVQALETDLEHVRAHTRLLVRSSEWSSRGEPRSLLLRGEDLKDAEALLVSAQGKEPGPTPAQARYVQASRQGAARRQRALISGVSVALVVALVLSVVAVVQRSEALNQRAVAERNAAQSRSRELASASVGQLNADPELSLLLAVRAMRIARTPEAVAALRQALTESHVRAALRDLGAQVESVSFSPDGSRVLVATSNGTARIWDPSSNSGPIDLAGHSDLIDAASFSADGSLAVTASFDETARVWDATSGSEVARLRGHEGAVNDAAFNPAGTLVVTGGEDGTARIWNARTGKQLRVLRGHERPVYDVSFSPDGSRVVTASDDDTARIWDARTGRVLQTLRGHEDGLYTAAFDPAGRRVVTASQEGTAQVWNVRTGKLETDLVGHQGPVVMASFSPDGRSIVTASEDKTARLWDAATGRQLQLFRGHRDQLNSALFSPDGREVVTTSLDGAARVWTATDGSSLAVLRGHVGPVLTAAFSPDGKEVVTGGQDGSVRIWEPVTDATLYSGSSSWSSTDTQTRIIAISNYNGSVTVVSTKDGRQLWSTNLGVPQTGVAVSPDARTVVSGGFDGVGHVFDARTGKEFGQLIGHKKGYFSADFWGTNDVLTWSDDGTARLWDPRTQEQLGVFDHGGKIWEAHLSADGQRVLTTGLGDGVIRMWDVATGKQLWSHSGLLGPPTIGGALSSDGSLVGTVSSQAVIWDGDTGKKITTLEDSQIHGMGFSSDDRTVSTRSADGGVRIWDPRTGSLLVQMLGPSEVSGVGVSSDERWVASTGTDDVTRIYDARSGEQVTSFEGEGGGGIYAAFADHDTSVVTFSGDGIGIHRCDACGTVDALLRLADARVTRPLTPSERATYLAPAGVGHVHATPRPAGLRDAVGEPVPDGALTPGAYTAVDFDPGLSFTIGDGWFTQTFVGLYKPPEVRLGRIVELIRADNPGNGLNFLVMDPGRVIDGHKEWDERRNIEPFPRDLAAWFADHPDLKVLRRGSMSVGGIPASFVDTLGTSIPTGTPWPNCGGGCITVLAMSLNNVTGPIGNNSILAGGVGEIDRWVVVRTAGVTFLIDAFSVSQKDFRKFIPIVNRVLATVTIG